jgi:hypothetical protein
MMLLSDSAARNRRTQRLDRQGRRVLFSRRQTPNRGDDLFAGQLQGICNSHSFQHLCQRRAARQRRRTAVGEEARGDDPAIANVQTQPQAIAADGVRLFSDCVCSGYFAHVARVREVIFEGFRV